MEKYVRKFASYKIWGFINLSRYWICKDSKIFKFYIEFNKNIITEAIKTSSFDNLKKLEKSGLFGESVADTKSGDKKDFFYLGPKNDCKKLLDNKISKEIEQNFQNEMKEL